ncbi:hypothetical protein HZC21_01000 [Candidatus Peregrinibacteria bacterium]|nr:hypothetical protein [Candidatus Peregrinibacteria bacterium]
MGKNFEIPKIEKIDTPGKAHQALIILDDDIERVSDLAKEEQEELLGFLEQLGKKIQQFKEDQSQYIPLELQIMLEDLTNDLRTLKDGEFKIDRRVETAKEKKDYNLEYLPEKENPSPVLDDIDLVYLHVVADGVRKTIILSSEQLKTNPVLHLDGYLASVIIFGKRDLEASIGEEKGYSLQGWKDEYFEAEGKTIYFEDLATKDYSAETLCELFYHGRKEEGIVYQPPGRLALGRIAIAKVGHSDDNMYEFVTSFLHSAMDIERFEDALSRPIRV